MTFIDWVLSAACVWLAFRSFNQERQITLLRNEVWNAEGHIQELYRRTSDLR